MASVRWRKLRRDVQAAWGRVLMMQLALALALAGVGTVLGARAVLDRGIRASYLSSRPADATLELVGGVDEALLAEVRARADVAEADRRQTVQARVRSRALPDDPWQGLVLFATDGGSPRLNTFVPGRGAWPPPRGAISLERTGSALFEIGRAGEAPAGEVARSWIQSMHGGHGGHGGHGDAARSPASSSSRVVVQTPHGAPREVDLAGTVHDAGLAPSWQEHRSYGYTTVETLALLGEPPLLRELLVQFRPPPRTMAEVDTAASALATWLGERGHPVHEIRIPRLRQHPHQGLMSAVQIVLLLFSALLLILTAVVMATMLSAFLARQARELGVMKAIGASTAQLVALYAGFVVALGAGALLVALPIASVGARAMISQVATMMNLADFDRRLPSSVFVALAALSIAVPLAFAMVPILRAARVTVRQSLSAHGASADFVRPSLSRLPIALRNALRRPVRLAFSMLMLGMAGMLVLSAANAQHGLAQVSSKLDVARRFDVELRLHEPVPAAQVASLASVAGVRRLESWPAVEAALVRAGQRFDVVHTYPDGGHGSSLLTAMPPGSTALNLPLRRGRWLREDTASEAGEVGEVVLGNSHPAARDTALGELLTLSAEGKRSTWRLVGVVEEIAGASAFVSEAAYRRATGDDGVRLLRLTTTARDARERSAIIAELERALADRGVAVQYAMPALLLRTIIDDHVALVVRAVLSMAGLLALVGFFGLGSMTAIGVAERTREIGVLKALGASQRRILRIFLSEALAVAAASSALAALLSLPMTMLINAHVALGTLSPPAFSFSPTALLAWPAAALTGSALACSLPALRAARLSIREALAEV